MKALITGGAGFAGSHLAEHLLNQNCDLTLIARPEESLGGIEHLLPQVRLEHADLRDFDRVRRILAEVRPHRIYHLAALSSVVESFHNPRECYDVNLGGTLNLLESWRDLGFEARLLLVSSSDVYGQVNEVDLPLREGSSLRPASPYAGSKVAAEFLALQFGLSYGLPVVRVRPFHHTGPRQSPAFVCSSLARQVAEIACGLRPAVISVGNPDVGRDFSDVRDIVRGYALLMDRGRAGEVYQLCSGRAVTVGLLIECLTAEVPIPIEVRIEATRVRAGEATVLWGDPARVRAEIAWSPEYELKKTLSDLEAYWEKQIRDGAALKLEHPAVGGVAL
ncbi:MAG TPA: GDP-mannose 4,6-dehydratase [Terriglobia bacterium]|nr:GDP-mannose 4,6-dehydratase [Terriglobia bacterium]